MRGTPCPTRGSSCVEVGGKKDPEAVERERKKQKKKARRVKAQAYKAAAPERERAAELARLSGLEAAPAGADDEDVRRRS